MQACDYIPPVCQTCMHRHSPIATGLFKTLYLLLMVNFPHQNNLCVNIFKVGKLCTAPYPLFGLHEVNQWHKCMRRLAFISSSGFSRVFPSHKMIHQIPFPGVRNSILRAQPREYTVPYSVPEITFCFKQVHHEKVVFQELGDQSSEE